MASQQAFTLNPSYSGPMVIAETLRKMKSNTGLNRMLSTYNKRFFILDLNHLSLYYLPDKSSHFTDSTDIPLSSIISIRVTKQSAGLEEDRIWKHEFVITTKKKTLELISDCRNTMHKILFALSNLINTKTNKPLFDWNHYNSKSQSQQPTYTLPISQSPDSSPQKQREETYSSPEKSPVDLQPEQRGEMSAELTKIERVSKEEAEQESPNRESCESDDQKENKQSQGAAKDRLANIKMRRKGNSFAAARGKGFEVEEKSPVEGQEKQEKEASPQKMEQREPGQQEEERGEVRQSASPSPVRNGEKIQIKIEMLNLERIENDIRGNESRQMNSYREGGQSNPGENVRRSANRLMIKNNKAASMKNMVGTAGEFVGCNEVDLSHQKNRTTKNVESSYGQRSARIVSDDKKMSFGTGAGQEASRFSLFKKSEESNVKKSESNDDDWDNEMFGNGKDQISPLKPKNHEQKQRLPFESKYMFNEKKSQLSQKRSEFVASRQGTHNDWDDEL